MYNDRDTLMKVLDLIMELDLQESIQDKYLLHKLK